MIQHSFPFRYEWGEVLRGLPREVRLEVYDAVIEYALSGTLPHLKPNARLAFTFIKAGLDRDREALTQHTEEARERCDGQDYALAQSAENEGLGSKEEIEQKKENLPPYNPLYKEKKIDREESDVVIGLTEDFNIYNPKEKEEEKERESAIIEALKSDRRWLELIEMRYRLKKNDIAAKLDEFALDQRCREKTHYNATEAKRHFANWMNIKIRSNDQQTAKTERDSHFAAYIADKLAGGQPSGGEVSGSLF